MADGGRALAPPSTVRGPRSRRPNPANSTPFHEPPAICGNPKYVKFAGMPCARVVKMVQDRPWLAHDDEGPKGRTEAHGDADEEVPEVRGLLLQEEHAVRAEPRRAVSHLPPRRARARAGASALVRLPHRAHPLGIRLPAGARPLVVPATTGL